MGQIHVMQVNPKTTYLLNELCRLTQTVYKRLSYDVNKFHWLGGFPLREVVFVHLGWSVFVVSVERWWVSFICTSWVIILASLINAIPLLTYQKKKKELCRSTWIWHKPNYTRYKPVKTVLCSSCIGEIISNFSNPSFG